MRFCAARKEEINSGFSVDLYTEFLAEKLGTDLAETRFCFASCTPGPCRFSKIAPDQIAGPIKCDVHFALEFPLVNQVGPLRENACDFYRWHIKTPN